MVNVALEIKYLDGEPFEYYFRFERYDLTVRGWESKRKAKLKARKAFDLKNVNVSWNETKVYM